MVGSSFTAPSLPPILITSALVMPKLSSNSASVLSTVPSVWTCSISLTCPPLTAIVDEPWPSQDCWLHSSAKPVRPIQIAIPKDTPRIIPNITFVLVLLFILINLLNYAPYWSSCSLGNLFSNSLTLFFSISNLLDIA